MKETNVIYTSAKAIAKDALTNLRDQEHICRKYLAKEGIIENIVVLNELQFGANKPVLESLRILMEAGYVKSVTLKSMDRISRNTRKNRELMELAVENNIDIHILDLNLNPILKMFILEMHKIHSTEKGDSKYEGA